MSSIEQSSSESERKERGDYGSRFKYDTKLLGILPTGFRHTEQDFGPWHMKNIKVVKKPSETSFEGQVEVMGHPALIGSGIVERKFGMSEFTSQLVGTKGNFKEIKLKEDKIKNVNVNANEVIDIEAKKTNVEDSLNPDSESNFDLKEEKEFESQFAVVNFYRNCYDSSWGKEPDFMSERLALIYMVDDDPFGVIARKVRYTPRDGKERETIQITFIPGTMEADDTTGSFFERWASVFHDPQSGGMIEDQEAEFETGTGMQKAEKEEEDSVEPKDKSLLKHHHHAYIQGNLSRQNLSVSNSNRRSSFSLGTKAFLGGIWKLEENFSDYTCAHLAEMRLVRESLIYPLSPRGLRDTFYKRVRMQRQWIQSHLGGLKQYMVSIGDNASKSNSNPDLKPPGRIMKELWLYDVEKIPRAIKVAAEEEKFKPWTPDELLEKLFTSLEFIYNTVQSKTGTSEEGKGFIFLRYPRDSEHLVHDPDGELAKDFIKCRRQITVWGLPEKTQLEMKSEEEKASTVEESPSDLQEQLEKYWMKNILDMIGYPQDFPYPKVQKPSNFQRWGHCLELTFPSKDLADCVLFNMRTFWKHKIDQMPKGFANVRAEIKVPHLPSHHPMAKQNYRRRDQGQVYGYGQGRGEARDQGHGRGDLSNWSNLRSPHHGNVRDGHQSSPSYASSSSVFRPPRSRVSASFSSSPSASDSNWRS